MKKIKFFSDFEKEEQFLNDMLKKGYRLERYNSLGVYTFRLAEPQALNYRIDYRKFSRKDKFEEYLTLFQDAGWEHVCGTRYSGLQYFLPNSDKVQTDDIFSDRESKLERYKRFSSQCFVSLTLMIVYLFILTPKNWSLFDVRSWYFSDGLWNMTGGMFLKAFLFETPFVVLRIAPFIVLLFLSIVNGYWALESRKHYKNNQH